MPLPSAEELSEAILAAVPPDELDLFRTAKSSASDSPAAGRSRSGSPAPLRRRSTQGSRRGSYSGEGGSQSKSATGLAEALGRASLTAASSRAMSLDGNAGVGSFAEAASPTAAAAARRVGRAPLAAAAAAVHSPSAPAAASAGAPPRLSSGGTARAAHLSDADDRGEDVPALTGTGAADSWTELVVAVSRRQSLRPATEPARLAPDLARRVAASMSPKPARAREGPPAIPIITLAADEREAAEPRLPQMPAVQLPVEDGAAPAELLEEGAGAAGGGEAAGRRRGSAAGAATSGGGHPASPSRLSLESRMRIEEVGGPAAAAAPRAAPAAGGPGVYRVKVRTGDKMGAGTDADVSIVMVGEEGRSAELALDVAGRNVFERGKARARGRRRRRRGAPQPWQQPPPPPARAPPAL